MAIYGWLMFWNSQQRFCFFVLFLVQFVIVSIYQLDRKCTHKRLIIMSAKWVYSMFSLETNFDESLSVLSILVCIWVKGYCYCISASGLFINFLGDKKNFNFWMLEQVIEYNIDHCGYWYDDIRVISHCHKIGECLDHLATSLFIYSVAIWSYHLSAWILFLFCYHTFFFFTVDNFFFWLTTLVRVRFVF